uniref:Golgi integral membrane protein 4-like n=1 Tax=Podarcis muralis TaxID=64176 RepID=UPI00109EF083|nr:Golgi integral membrane protein 4-like [Podarcis muralis]
MGTGLCTRRQKGLLQTGFCLVAVACLASGAFLYNHLQQKVKSAEALALKYKQQQEVLSAQLQVVYEHRSRLERSLQKERGEHKKTKEDFLVYKLEAQEALNKEKQDSMNRYGALSSQHKILKNQHEDVKKQLLDLQMQHNGLKLEHRKITETHNQKYSQLQREKESEVGGLQGECRILHSQRGWEKSAAEIWVSSSSSRDRVIHPTLPITPFPSSRAVFWCHTIALLLVW